jgi:hypothetical protein
MTSANPATHPPRPSRQREGGPNDIRKARNAGQADDTALGEFATLSATETTAA